MKTSGTTGTRRNRMVSILVLACVMWAFAETPPATADQPAAADKSTAPKKDRPTPGYDWIVPELGMAFVWIEQMQCWVGKFEVTNGEYRQFVPKHDSGEAEGHSLNRDRQPVVQVSFDEAMKYAQWLTESERKAERLPGGYQYRLPTDEEWTVFCQCGDSEDLREFPWGNHMPPRRGNYSDQSRRASRWLKISNYDDKFPVTCSVAMSGSNSWGLYGVGGNVWEMTIKSSTEQVFEASRGASWRVNGIPYLRSLARLGASDSRRNNSVGFRLVLAP